MTVRGVYEEYEISLTTGEQSIGLAVRSDSGEWCASLSEVDVEAITKKSGCLRSLSEFKELVKVGVQGGGCVDITVCTMKELTTMYPSPTRQQSTNKKRYLLLDYDMSYGRALYTIILKQVDSRTGGLEANSETRRLKKENADLKKLNNTLYQRAKEDSEILRRYDGKIKEQKEDMKLLKAELAKLHRELVRERERGRSMSRGSRNSQRSGSLTSNGSRGSRGSHNSRNSMHSRTSSQQARRSSRPLPVPVRRSPSIRSDDSSAYSHVSSRYGNGISNSRRSYRRSPSSSDNMYPTRRTSAYMGNSRDSYTARRPSPNRRWR